MEPWFSIIYSDSTFGFESKKIHFFHFLVAILLQQFYTVLPIPLRLAISIQKTRIASMEQIADLYALEHTAEASASTSRTTGSRNFNVGLFASLYQALARIGVLEQDLAADRATRQNALEGAA